MKFFPEIRSTIALTIVKEKLVKKKTKKLCEALKFFLDSKRLKVQYSLIPKKINT